MSSHTSAAMETIRRKLASMRQEKEDAIDTQDKEDQKCRKIEEEIDRVEVEGEDYRKKIAITESEIATLTLQLKDLQNRLESENQKADNCEAQLSGLQKELRECEEEIEKSETKLISATALLDEASTAADESDRGCKAFEQRKLQDKDRRNMLAMQLNDVQYTAQAADDNYADAAKKMETIDLDLDLAEKQAREAEARLVELEEELRVVGNTVRSLEVSNEKRKSLESAAEEQIKDLSNKLQIAEERVQTAEGKTLVLQEAIDKMEDEISIERNRYKAISEELETTLIELSSY